MSAIDEPAEVPGAPGAFRSRVLTALRRTGLLSLAEAVQRARLVRREAADNAAFLAEHPEFVAPPPGQVFEVTGSPSFRRFSATGHAACAALAALADDHLDRPLGRVLDWGVGPARVARWWPVLRPGVEVHGGDPWAAAIAWGERALPAVRFHRLPALPPTGFADAQFDLAYGVSILTHLGVPAQRAWLAELRRIVRPGGLLALTLQGRGALSRLSTAERARWEAGEVVVRSQVREGSRLYQCHHPPAFLRDTLFADWAILAHEPSSIVGAGGQDLWLLRRPGS